jgi:hypothetical protein
MAEKKSTPSKPKSSKSKPKPKVVAVKKTTVSRKPPPMGGIPDLAMLLGGMPGMGPRGPMGVTRPPAQVLPASMIPARLPGAGPAGPVGRRVVRRRRPTAY